MNKPSQQKTPRIAPAFTMFEAIAPREPLYTVAPRLEPATLIPVVPAVKAVPVRQDGVQVIEQVRQS